MWLAPTLGGGRNELNLKWGRGTITWSCSIRPFKDPTTESVKGPPFSLAPSKPESFSHNYAKGKGESSSTRILLASFGVRHMGHGYSPQASFIVEKLGCLAAWLPGSSSPNPTRKKLRSLTPPTNHDPTVNTFLRAVLMRVEQCDWRVIRPHRKESGYDVRMVGSCVSACSPQAWVARKMDFFGCFVPVEGCLCLASTRTFVHDDESRSSYICRRRWCWRWRWTWTFGRCEF